MKRACSWCEGRESEKDLCDTHLAESLGMSLAEMERGEREMSAEYNDTIH